MADYEYPDYRPLNTKDQEIRLLRIVRPSPDAEIHGTLETYSSNPSHKMRPQSTWPSLITGELQGGANR